MKFLGEYNLSFKYVPSHLYYILFERAPFFFVACERRSSRGLQREDAEGQPSRRASEARDMIPNRNPLTVPRCKKKVRIRRLAVGVLGEIYGKKNDALRRSC